MAMAISAIYEIRSAIIGCHNSEHSRRSLEPRAKAFIRLQKSARFRFGYKVCHLQCDCSSYFALFSQKSERYECHKRRRLNNGAVKMRQAFILAYELLRQLPFQQSDDFDMSLRTIFNYRLHLTQTPLCYLLFVMHNELTHAKFIKFATQHERRIFYVA